MSLLGIDLGTTGVRAACYDVTGRLLAAEAIATPLTRTGDRIETDAEAILTAVERATRSVVAHQAVLEDPIASVSFSVQGEAVVPVDLHGRALALAPVSMDRRGAQAASRIGDLLGSSRVLEITGQPLHPMFSLYKIVAGDPSWSAPNVAEYRTIDAFVAARWGASSTIDYSTAARTGLFDVGARDWSSELIDAGRAVGGRLSRSTVPETVAAGTPIGAISAGAASRTGLPEGTPIVAGAHDQAASFLGAGGSAGRTSVFSFGSSDCLTIASRRRPAGLERTGFASYPLADDHWITLAGTAAGGWALEWWAATMGDDVAATFDELAEHPPRLLVLPYFTGSGTLDNDPGARAVIAGLTLATGRDELARAFIEASGFELAKILDALAHAAIEVGAVNAVGTGASNRPALTVRANAAGVPLHAVPGHSAARGAAFLAGIGIAVYADVHSLPPSESTTPAHPDTQLRPWYDSQRAAYRELYEGTKPINNRLLAPKENENP